MSKKHLMIGIDWYGPYPDLHTAKKIAKNDFDNGLYICIGKCKKFQKRSIQYIGIGSPIHRRLTKDHHKLKLVTRKHQIWLGEIVTSEPSGRKIKVTPQTLDYAEWLHAYCLNLPLNEKKTKNAPPRIVTVMNWWWKEDYKTPWTRKPHPNWPKLIDFQGNDIQTILL